MRKRVIRQSSATVTCDMSKCLLLASFKHELFTQQKQSNTDIPSESFCSPLVEGKSDIRVLTPEKNEKIRIYVSQVMTWTVVLILSEINRIHNITSQSMFISKSIA